MPAPPQFRAAEPQPSNASLSDTKWFDLFQDETLRGLIKEALQANFDIHIAAQRVLQAQGQLTATRSGLFPQLNAQCEIWNSVVYLNDVSAKLNERDFVAGRAVFDLHGSHRYSGKEPARHGRNC